MDAAKDLEDNRISQLEDDIRQLELEINVLSTTVMNLRAENDRLMQQLASGASNVQ